MARSLIPSVERMIKMASYSDGKAISGFAGTWCFRVMLSLGLLMLCSPGLAYERDSHYYLRFGLSLLACYDWDEAHLIASGDWGMDENGSTHAEMNPVQTRNKIGWHAFGHSDRRFNELWQRSLEEEDLELRLIKLGQFMHFLEDWESHAGYGIRMGHARDTFRGRDPDSLGNSYPKNHRMVQSALDHLLKTCADIGRLEGDSNHSLVRIMNLVYADGLMDDVFELSDPRWRRGKAGSFRPEGEAIKLAVKSRVESMIEDHVASLPQKNVPADFAAGTGTGIPPSLAIPFDADGRVVVKDSVVESLREWARNSEIAPDIVLSLDKVRIFYRGTGSRRPAGWQVRVTASNQGELASPEGQVEVAVIDSDDERLLAQSARPLETLQPGESVTMDFRIPARATPEPDVIVGAFARVGDNSAMNDEDWLMLGDAEEESPIAGIRTDLDPPVESPETVRFLGPPGMFIVNDEICIVVSALMSGGDSPEKLDKVVGEVLGGRDQRSFVSDLAVPGRWSAFVSDKKLVAGKTFECYQPDPATYQFLKNEDPGALELSITIKAHGSEPFTQSFPVAPEFVASVLELLERFSGLSGEG